MFAASVMSSCTGNFLIRGRECDVLINNFCPVKQFRSRSAFHFTLSFLGVMLVLANFIL